MAHRPHVPRPAGVPWDDRIPYPVFMVGCHILLQDCLAGSGPSGDIVFFVSDIWHRRMPTGSDDEGRFFLQVQYGRRDIAQRLQTTDKVNLSVHRGSRSSDHAA